MNKLTYSIEFSFDVDAGTIELLDDDKWCVNQLIAPEVFIERYRNYKLDLMDKTHIDETAQQVQKSTYKGVWITGDGDIMLRCCADWMVNIKMHGSSNSVDDVALLIKNAIERAIDGSEISVKYKVLY